MIPGPFHIHTWKPQEGSLFEIMDLHIDNVACFSPNFNTALYM